MIFCLFNPPPNTCFPKNAKLYSKLHCGNLPAPPPTYICCKFGQGGNRVKRCHHSYCQSIWAVFASICSSLANWQALHFRFSLGKKCYVKLKKGVRNLKLQLCVFYRHGCWPPSEWPVASVTMTSKFMTPTSTSNRSSPVVLRWEPALLIACWHAQVSLSPTETDWL